MPAALLVCLATAALVAAAAPAKPTAATGGRTAALQNDLDALVAAGAPGAILLVRNGNHTTRLTAGLADVTSKRPMRASDRFRIASVTKSYTASIVLQLVAEGKLGLERQRRTAAAKARSERRADHHPAAAQPHERPL